MDKIKKATTTHGLKSGVVPPDLTEIGTWHWIAHEIYQVHQGSKSTMKFYKGFGCKKSVLSAHEEIHQVSLHKDSNEGLVVVVAICHVLGALIIDLDVTYEF